MSVQPPLWLLLLLCIWALSGAAADLALPRGVPLSRASLYPPGETFTCLDGSSTIAFSYVNDDYCDCDDGSDEPGTAACAAGTFFCANIGHMGQQVPSSWVNDGICDCCDGSDEYSTGACGNTCDELGAVVRARQAQLNEMRQRGFQLRQQLVQQAQQSLTEKQTRLTELEREKEVAENVKEQREAAKSEAEEREHVLLDAFQEVQRAREAEREQAEKMEAEQYFSQMDTDQNEVLTSEELKLETKLDKNGDGAVTQDEVDSVTMNKAEMDREEFTTSIWPLLKPLLEADSADELEKPPAEQPSDVETTDNLPNPETAAEEEHLAEDGYDPPEEEEDGDGEEDEEDDDEDEDVGVGSYSRVGGHRAPESAPEPEYDAETQAAVDAAKQARAELSEAETKLHDIEREVTSVTGFTEMDLGPDRVFAALHHQCFSMENREYEYKLCLFEKATQKPRSGGIETSLGRWGHWISPEQKTYTEQMYENGQQCWNGPKRSAHVTLTCGEETRVLDVTEPAMCEYLFTMQTPAVCQPPDPEPQQLFHDEL